MTTSTRISHGTTLGVRKPASFWRGLPRCKNLWHFFFVFLARAGVWLLFNGLLALLFSLFYVICEFDKFLHRGWAFWREKWDTIVILKWGFAKMPWCQNKSRTRPVAVWHFSISKMAHLATITITEQPKLLRFNNC